MTEKEGVEMTANRLVSKYFYSTLASQIEHFLIFFTLMYCFKDVQINQTLLEIPFGKFQSCEVKKEFIQTMQL